jgi:hypothetical protein
MRARQEGQRAQSLGMAIGNDPGEAGAPIMADKMKAPAVMADSRDDVERVADQQLDAVTGVSAGSGRASAEYPRWFGATAK